MDNSIIEKRVVCGADVFSGKDLIPQILPRLRSVFEEGALCVVYENEYEDSRNRTLSRVEKGRLSRFFDKRIPRQNTRRARIRALCFCGGCARRGGKSKRNFSEYRHGVVYAFLCARQRRYNVWKMSESSVYRRKYIDKVQKRANCGGYGILLSQKFAEFERAFQKTVLGEKVKQFAVETSSCPLSELAYRLIEISSRKQGKDTAERMAEVMSALALSKGKTPRLTGEYRFLASAVLTSFYSGVSVLSVH